MRCRPSIATPCCARSTTRSRVTRRREREDSARSKSCARFGVLAMADQQQKDTVDAIDVAAVGARRRARIALELGRARWSLVRALPVGAAAGAVTYAFERSG